MKKLLLLVAAVFFAMTSNAQIVSSTSRNITHTTYEIEDEDQEKKNILGIDLNVGKMGAKNEYSDEKDSAGAFGLGLYFEHRYSKYFAWDILSVGWDAPFDSPSNFDRVTVKTGVRAFTPKFFKNMRGYANFAFGYAACLMKVPEIVEHSYYVAGTRYHSGYWNRWTTIEEGDFEAYHGAAIEFGFGLHLTKRLSAGYAFDWDSKSKYKGHYFRFGLMF